MRITLTWLRLDSRRRWRSLIVLGLLVALATMTVLAAVAGARRGQTVVTRLWALTLPATITVLPNQPGFDWARIRALPEVAALTTFGISGFAVDGYPLADQEAGYPFADRQAMRTIERPVVLQGRVSDPSRVDEVVVTPKFLMAYGQGVGDTLTLSLPSPQQAEQGYDPADGVPARGPRIRVRIVGVIRSFLFSDSIGSTGEVFPSPALVAHYRANFMGRHVTTYLSSLVRLRGGVAALPAFRADLARVTRRSDIDMWNNVVDFGAPARRVSGVEAACLLAFGVAALAAALFLVGQSVARYISSTMTVLHLLRAPGSTPWQAVASASVNPSSPRWQAPPWAWPGSSCPRAGCHRRPSLLEPHPGIDATGPSGHRLGCTAHRASRIGGCRQRVALAADRDRPAPHLRRAGAGSAGWVSVVVGTRALVPDAGVPPCRCARRWQARSSECWAWSPRSPSPPGFRTLRPTPPGSVRPISSRGSSVSTGVTSLRPTRSCEPSPATMTSPASTMRGSRSPTPATHLSQPTPITRSAASGSPSSSQPGGCPRPRMR
jgi:hypothetical protein